MTATIATVTGATGAQASGNGTQAHIVYATNSRVWWAFYVDPAAPTVLCSAYSADLVTWTAGATVTLANAVGNIGDGRYISAAYASIGGADVVHLFCTCAAQTVYDVRGVLSPTGVVWASPASIPAVSTHATDVPDGLAGAVASDGGVFVSSGQLDNTAGGFDNFTYNYNATADTSAASWTPGAWTDVKAKMATQDINIHAAIPLGGGVVLFLVNDDAVSPAQNVQYCTGSMVGGFSVAEAFATSVAFGNANNNEWSACARTATDVHCVRRTGANSYEHRRFDGTAWSDGQSIPAQTSKSGAGVALASDGRDVYLAVIDSAAGNAVQYIKWSGEAMTWGTWQTLDGTSATRTQVSTAPGSGNGPKLPFLWTEGAASPFVVKVAGVSLISTPGLTLRNVNI